MSEEDNISILDWIGSKLLAKFQGFNIDYDKENDRVIYTPVTEEGMDNIRNVLKNSLDKSLEEV